MQCIARSKRNKTYAANKLSLLISLSKCAILNPFTTAQLDAHVISTGV